MTVQEAREERGWMEHAKQTIKLQDYMLETNKNLIDSCIERNQELIKTAIKIVEENVRLKKQIAKLESRNIFELIMLALPFTKSQRNQ
jgi:hypothetical protein